MAKVNYRKLAKDVYDWCKANELWDGCCMYFKGDAWASWGTWGDEQGEELEKGLYLYENADPRKTCEYANPMTFSMSYDCSDLYMVLQDFGYSFPNMYEEFQSIFEKHGCWYELCNSWMLTACED